MDQKLAIKRLTKSELTFFASHFRVPENNTRQKALNLNADVFINEMYPQMKDRVEEKIALTMNIFGPGFEGLITETSSITKEQKNWRLNGLVHDLTNPTRFDVLTIDDFVVFNFFGELVPQSVDMVFLANKSPEDATLCSKFIHILSSGPRMSMKSLTLDELKRLTMDASPPEAHPIFNLISRTDFASSNDPTPKREVLRQTTLWPTPTENQISLPEQSESRAKGTQILRPRARILRTLGDELISSETVAIIELVKNAYDADATRVLVQFMGRLESGNGSITIMDNGHGMSLETIKSTWMEPATLSKKRNPRSERRKRRVLGEKGIGRFAASRLANYLDLVTRRSEKNSEYRVLFDWNQFDDSEKYLDQVEVLWEETEPKEICPDGTISVLWNKKDLISDRSDLIHGTILRMEELRSDWKKEQLESLRIGLSRLVSPFFDQGKNFQDEFEIFLSLPEPFSYLSGIVEQPETLKNPHYLIRGTVDESGNYDLQLYLKGQADVQLLSGQFIIGDNQVPQCGPFFIELRVWDRDREALGEIARSSDATLKDVRRDLDDAAGVNIYRDGFRVLPYGEPRNDWLRLDRRRVQNPTQRLSNNQIVGYILISNDANPLLRDQSNREGLMEGPALDDLSTLVKMVMVELETRRYSIRPRREKTTARGLFADFDLDTIAEAVKQRHGDDVELVELIGEKERDLTQRVERVQDVIARYRRLATLGKLINTILHDGRTPLARIRNRAQIGQDNIKDAHRNNDTLIIKLGQHFDIIEMNAETLSTLFNRIEPFGGRKRGRPEQVILEQIISDVFSLLETEVANKSVEINLPKSKTTVTVDAVEIREVIYNLLDNSLYWLTETPKDQRKIIVQVIPTQDDGAVTILFSDSGPGVAYEFRESIFDPWFSRKPDGEGLGLAIAGEIVSDYYDGSLELIDSDILPGATFRITLRKRV